MGASDGKARPTRRVHEKRVHWHSRTHKDWGKERLYFWRLRFRPTYPRADVERELHTLFTEERIGSYTVYETFGDWDLLVRLWLPATLGAQDFKNLLAERLGRFNLSHDDSFEVDSVLRHWVWGESEPASPSDDRMRHAPPPDRQITEVNEGHPCRELVTKLSSENLVREVRRSDGIKFAMIVTAPVNDLPLDQRPRAQSTLKEIVDRAADVEERSLYHGHGFGAFLILGRVAYRNFDAIRDQLADPIAKEIGTGWIGARTYTMIVASWEFLAFRDELPLARELSDEEIGIEEALSRPEYERVEVKGSAFIDYKVFFVKNGQRVKNQNITHSVLKAVTGLLNTDGGTLVIGALEPNRFVDVEKMLNGTPRRGEYACVGIENDWGTGKGAGWDSYQRHLSDLIKKHIEPLATTWIMIDFEQIEHRHLARIVVNRPDDQWYYLHRLDDKGRFTEDQQFWVRHGGSTINLQGPDADEYKRVRRRR